ncbi:DUF402 domain-containing protein [Corynebacterium sp. TAE3-ERU12]|uniref:DUF402 domain-containing protein n=1 Tax=Corynebacterium sp. TAE3-ERU12 TaxID=2849491 RepID=UPI001C437F2D|nr:DUF402 domain-containing protein [Corynebacterium sp. TAE3-ERU12]MBV7295039.1 DUF402 domain-containing protein [Corynebacterium sp. TAE3-ERU12]
MSEDHAPVKAPKYERFAIAAGVNSDPKGFLREVDTYREHPFGLYLARGADHPDFGYLQSWLLPDLGLRVSIFHRRPTSSYDFDFYLDIADIDRPSSDGGSWSTTDLYLDVVVAGTQVRVEDADELTAAVECGLVSAERAASAIDRAWTAAVGITAQHGDVDAWLASQGCPVSWAQPDSVTLVAQGAWPEPTRDPQRRDLTS